MNTPPIHWVARGTGTLKDRVEKGRKNKKEKAKKWIFEMKKAALNK
jgi:hypothetical protein